MKVLVSSIVALSLSLLGCADDGAAPAEHGTKVFVGLGAGNVAGHPVNGLVGVVLEASSLELYACGDEQQGTRTTVWLGATDLDTSSAEIPVSSVGSTGWQFDGLISGDVVTGTILRNDGVDRIDLDNAVRVAPDDPDGAGVYTDFGGCRTGLIVAPGGDMLGSFCSSVDLYGQVTPLMPKDEGYLVRLEDAAGQVEVMLAPLLELDGSF